MNPRNGEILALASIPGFNPNKYNRYDVKTFNNAVISDLSELLHADIVRNVVSKEINNDL